MNVTTAPTSSSESPYADPLLGRLVNGKYQILSSVAAGGMGKIYRAEQIPLGRPVALKVLHPRHTSTGDAPALKKRFLREASILSKLQHPNIVTVFDYGKIDGTPEEGERLFMAMEYLSGETLLQRLVTRTRLSWTETAIIARQIARGLREAHAHGIVHRDLKPSNIMLVANSSGGEERVKIVDFGIVKVLKISDKDQELTQEGCLVGSPNYMAPEQVAAGKVDARADTYSLGVIIYQCLTGSFPFDASSGMQMMVAHATKPVIPLHTRIPDLNVPDWLEELVMRCLEKTPERRPASMEEVLRIIQEQSRLASSSMPRLTPAGPSSSRGSSSAHRARTDGPTPAPSASASLAPEARKRPSLFGAAVLLVAAIGAAAAFLSRSTPAHHGTTFNLEIRSEPSGAEVQEGDRSLGTTPLVLSLDNDAVRASPRVLSVRKEGREPYSIVQGASERDVTLVARLAPSPSAGPAPTAPAAPQDTSATSASTGGAAPVPDVVRPRSGSSTQPLDIELKR